MRYRPAVFLLVVAVCAGGCEAGGGDEAAARPPAVAFAAVDLPSGAVPAVLAPTGDALLVGVRDQGRPRLLLRAADGVVTDVPVHGATPYGMEATWQSLAVDGDALLAIGGERGGAHGSVRWSIWTGTASVGVTEQPQGFSTFNGWGAGDLVDAVRPPAGPALIGTWQSADTAYDVAVWTPDGADWVRQSSAGTALESRRGALGFPIAASALGRSIVVVGWRLADGGQQPVVWRSEAGNAGWTATPLPDAGRAGAASAVRCWDGGCAAAGWVDGTLAVWRLTGTDWVRLSGTPPIAVGDRERLVAPVEVDGKLAMVVSDGGRPVLARADGDTWTVRDVAGPAGTASAMTVVGDALYLVAGTDENTRALWRAEAPALG